MARVNLYEHAERGVCIHLAGSDSLVAYRGPISMGSHTFLGDAPDLAAGGNSWFSWRYVLARAHEFDTSDGNRPIAVWEDGRTWRSGQAISDLATRYLGFTLVTAQDGVITGTVAAEFALEISATARMRLIGCPRLQCVAGALAPAGRGDDYLQWLATAPSADLVDWAQASHFGDPLAAAAYTYTTRKVWQNGQRNHGECLLCGRGSRRAPTHWGTFEHIARMFNVPLKDLRTVGRAISSVRRWAKTDDGELLAPEVVRIFRNGGLKGQKAREELVTLAAMCALH